MDTAPRPPQTTREFAVRWHTVLEEHSVNRLAGILSRLAPLPADTDAPPPEAYAELADHLHRALQMAANPSAGVEESIRYLMQLAAELGRPATDH